MTMDREACVLISASCTTSWFDWIHGELWLCPDGLLRRSVGLIGTFRHAGARGIKATVDATARPTRTFTASEIEGVLRAGRRNRWVPWTDVTSVTLKLGIIDHSLHVTRRDGRRDKFLWLQMDGGYDLLQIALRDRLGDRFKLWDQPTG